MSEPSFDETKRLFIDWFTENYGRPPVVTSSTGLPAVHFALYALQHFGAQKQEIDD